MKESESNVFLQQNQYPLQRKTVSHLTLFGVVMKYQSMALNSKDYVSVCLISVAKEFWHSCRTQWRRDFLKKPFQVGFAEVWPIISVHRFSGKKWWKPVFPCSLWCSPSQASSNAPWVSLCCMTAPIHLQSMLNLHVQNIGPAVCHVLQLCFFSSGSLLIMSAAWYCMLNCFHMNYSDPDQTALTWLLHGCDI